MYFFHPMKSIFSFYPYSAIVKRVFPIALFPLFSFTQCNINFAEKKGQVSDTDLHALILPKGFRGEIYAHSVKNARAMSWGKDNMLFVGSRDEGKVYAIPDKNKDGIGEKAVLVAEGLSMPTGIAYKDGALYVSEISRILKFENIDELYDKKPTPVPLPFSFPKEEHHGWKYLKFGPDEKLYVSLGAPCNLCERDDDERFASILRLDLESGGTEIFARGVRNSVGFDWHPEDDVLYFTDNGRDWFGDDLPPCELNRAPRKGMHFGFPYCHGGQYADPDFNNRPCEDFEKPFQNLGPHVAPLGMCFYTGTQFPEKYKNGIFVAEHGSWNRSQPIGYRVTFIGLDEQMQSTGYEIFADGFLQKNGDRWGRPADIIMHPDGSILVSDDFGDAIYKISYRAE